MEIKIVDFCSIELVCATRDEFAKFVIHKSKEFKCNLSFSLNGESLAKFHHDAAFRKLFLNADYVHADGMSIVSASKKLSAEALPERIATTDWFHDVAKLSEKSGESHYFLGGDENTIQRTATNVRKLYPNLVIAGYRNGYFSEADQEEVLVDINKARPNFIWVGLGRPKQELFSLLIRDNCEVGLIKTCGGLFDFLSGNNKRAPELMQKLGLEWLYRLSLEPTRLFKRYFTTNLQCLIIFAKYYFAKK